MRNINYRRVVNILETKPTSVTGLVVKMKDLKSELDNQEVDLEMVDNIIDSPDILYDVNIKDEMGEYYFYTVYKIVNNYSFTVFCKEY